jgi:hypothetical protein
MRPVRRRFYVAIIVWLRASKAFCGAVAMLSLLFPVVIGHSAEQRPGIRETIIAGDYFGAGVNASPGETVDGDAFIAAGDLSLNQPVNGDAVLAGGRVSIAARVGGDLYAAGGTVMLNAPTAGNARLAGGHVELGKRGQVSGKTTLAGGRVSVFGNAGRQLAVFGEHVTLDGEVNGDVTIASRTLSIGPSARVTGKLTYRGSSPVQMDPAAIIAGGVNYLSFNFEDETYQPVARAVAWVGAIAFTVGLFLIGMLAILLLPNSTAHMSRLGRRRPIASLALGLVTISCVPIAVVLLLLTIVGIPFALMLLLVWPIILIFGYLAGVMAVSDAVAGPIAQAKGRRIFLLAMGMGVMLLFARVPFAGWIIGMVLLIMGIGAMGLNAMGATVPIRVKKEKREVPARAPAEPAARQEPTFRVD